MSKNLCVCVIANFMAAYLVYNWITYVDFFFELTKFSGLVI